MNRTLHLTIAGSLALAGMLPKATEGLPAADSRARSSTSCTAMPASLAAALAATCLVWSALATDLHE